MEGAAHLAGKELCHAPSPAQLRLVLCKNVPLERLRGRRSMDRILQVGAQRAILEPGSGFIQDSAITTLPKHCQSLPKHCQSLVKACQIMPKTAKALPNPAKACQSLPKHCQSIAKAWDLPVTLRETPLHLCTAGSCVSILTADDIFEHTLGGKVHRKVELTAAPMALSGSLCALRAPLDVVILVGCKTCG